MKRIESECFAKRVCEFYVKNGHDKNKTFHHFSSEGKCRRTIYRIIERFAERGSAVYMKLSGRPRVATSTRNLSKIQKLIDNNPRISSTKLAVRLRVSQSSIQRAKKRLSIKSFTQKSAPKYINNQESRCRKGASKLYLALLDGKKIVMDDECYVPCDPEQIPGKHFFMAKNLDSLCNKVIFRAKSKFPAKYLIWQALDSDGNVSEPYVSKGTINTDTYLHILKNYLIPFIELHHTKEEVIFWPDLAPAHYSKKVIAFLTDAGVKFVDRKSNTPNMPQGRPIEKFWALSKRKYSLRSAPAKNIRGFKKIWKNITAEVAAESAQNLVKNLKQKLRQITREGVYAPLRRAFHK